MPKSFVGDGGAEESGPIPKRRRLSKEDKAQFLKAKKRADQREIQLRARQEEATLRRLSLTSSKLPGEEYQPIRAGPATFTFARARGGKVFLIRNVKLGSHFLSRKRLLQSRRLK